jgi:hypothetical protein
MKNLMRSNNNYLHYVLLAVVMLAVSPFVFGQQATTQERVAAFKQSLAKNQAGLRKYQWVETTTVSLKGEVKSVKQNACYYGADGKVQKTPIASPAPAQEQSGGRGGRLKQKVIANKKEEMTDYMQRAVQLIGQYVPPNPELIKYSKETNNIKVEAVEPNRVIRLSFPGFIKNGDLMSATLNIVSNTIEDVNVSTWLENEKDAITLAVMFSQLGDGTSFTGKTTLKAPAKNIVVVVENSGHRPL